MKKKSLPAKKPSLIEIAQEEGEPFLGKNSKWNRLGLSINDATQLWSAKKGNVTL